jgi:ABC-type amino acid transport substrate-binding protein
VNRRDILRVPAITVLGLAVIPGRAIAQQEMLNEQLTATPMAGRRQALAPSGKLRVGVYPGSPYSMIRDPVSGEMKGIAVELGKAFATRLGVPYEQVDFGRPAEIYEALKAGQVDMRNELEALARGQHLGLIPFRRSEPAASRRWR